MKDFIFFNVLYPLFKKQINSLLEKYRLSQVCTVEVDSQHQVWVRVNKAYPKGSILQIFALGSDIFDPETGEYYGMIEEVYAIGTVQEVLGKRSKVLLQNQKLGLRVVPGLLVKSIYMGNECLY